MSKEAQIADLTVALTNSIEENKLLKQELTTLKKLIFGSKSERFKNEVDASQLSFFATSDAVKQPVEPEIESIHYERKKRRTHPGRNKLPEHLPVQEVVIEPDQDTTGLKKIGEEVTETLKYSKASLVKVRTIRNKYEKKDQQGVLIAPLPSRALHKCIAEPSLLSHMFVSKFVDHLPFYRQIKMFKRDFDWHLSSSTLNGWFSSSCEILKPVYQQMVNRIKESYYIQVDESPIKVLESEKAKQTHQGYQWVYHSPIDNLVVFQYRKGRGMNGPKEFLSNYQGYLQSDGYKVYDKIGQSPDIQLIGCLAHARRYFHQAIDNDKSRAEYGLEIFKAIYDVNRRWKSTENKLTQLERKKQIDRQLSTLYEWCEKNIYEVIPKSSIGKAIGYYLKQYPKLKKVAATDEIEIDNNLIENKIRPLALGRKNYLFAGSHNAAQRIAIMYSFFATCKAKNKDPGLWLENTLMALANPEVDISTLIP